MLLRPAPVNNKYRAICIQTASFRMPWHIRMIFECVQNVFMITNVIGFDIHVRKGNFKTTFILRRRKTMSTVHNNN